MCSRQLYQLSFSCLVWLAWREKYARFEEYISQLPQFMTKIHRSSDILSAWEQGLQYGYNVVLSHLELWTTSAQHFQSGSSCFTSMPNILARRPGFCLMRTQLNPDTINVLIMSRDRQLKYP